MNLFPKLKLTLLSAILLSVVLVFTNCNNAAPAGTTDGYTGTITDSTAKKLVSICHFISQSEIEDWVGRYKKDSAQKMIAQNQPAINYLLSNSCSFNSCIIRKLINDPQSIGLRVIYGMSPDNKMHLILTGIKPDYSNLYVKQDDCCSLPAAKTTPGFAPAGAPPGNGGDNGLGGAEYGQMP